MNYYNEIDSYAAQWLRNLIQANLIPPGVVDDRSILDVKPDDLRPYVQCHFFAGIAGWPLALSLATGVPARVGKLRAAGNAIVPQVAAEFIKSLYGLPPGTNIVVGGLSLTIIRRFPDVSSRPERA